MPRLRNTATGAVVNVSEEKAARLGPEWEPAETGEKPKRGRAKAKPEEAPAADSE